MRGCTGAKKGFYVLFVERSVDIFMNCKLSNDSQQTPNEY